MKKLLDFFINYFRNTKNYSTRRFILEMIVVAFVAKMIFGLIFYFVFSAVGISTGPGYQEGIAADIQSDIVFASIFYIIIGPFIETVILQGLVVYLTSKFTKNLYVLVLVSAVIFSATHGEPLIMLSVFPVGVIFAWSYILYLQKSFWKAVGVTLTIHLFVNLIAIIFSRYVF